VATVVGDFPRLFIFLVLYFLGLNSNINTVSTQFFYKMLYVFCGFKTLLSNIVERHAQISKKADTRIQSRNPPNWKLNPDNKVPRSLPAAFDM